MTNYTTSSDNCKHLPLFDLAESQSYSRDPDQFGGSTFDYQQDFARLNSHLEKVAHLMSDGRGRTLNEISIAVGCSESGASARLRDLRKPKFANRFNVMAVESERVTGGLWKYRVIFRGGA